MFIVVVCECDHASLCLSMYRCLCVCARAHCCLVRVRVYVCASIFHSVHLCVWWCVFWCACCMQQIQYFLIPFTNSYTYVCVYLHIFTCVVICKYIYIYTRMQIWFFLHRPLLWHAGCNDLKYFDDLKYSNDSKWLYLEIFSNTFFWWGACQNEEICVRVCLFIQRACLSVRKREFHKPFHTPPHTLFFSLTHIPACWKSWRKIDLPTHLTHTHPHSYTHSLSHAQTYRDTEEEFPKGDP